MSYIRSNEEWDERVVADAKAGFPMPAPTNRISPDTLAQLLGKHGIVDPCAIDDPDGFDGGRMLDRINVVARELGERDDTPLLARLEGMLAEAEAHRRDKWNLTQETFAEASQRQRGRDSQGKDAAAIRRVIGLLRAKEAKS